MFQQKLQSFMIGRNGVDHFGKFTSIASLVLMVITLFTNNGLLYLLAMGLLIYTYFRMMSKNIGKRQLENQKYLQITDRIRSRFNGVPAFWKIRAFFNELGRKIRYGSNDAQARAAKRAYDKEQKKIYKFYTCSSCGQKVRVPKGKGKIEITCPKCKNTFIKRT
ncbi:MAG: hypothetical protein K5675_10245 [Lachnospiraceae bacterium]|nr:hypothetical protein [Lachnospiraceae bacterium]